MRRLIALFAMFGALALIPGCGGCGGGGGGGRTGSILVISDYKAATRSAPGYADTLRVTVTPPVGVALPGTFPNPFLLNRTSTSRTLGGLAPSVLPYVFDMEALTDGTVVGTVQRIMVVSAGASLIIDVSADLDSEVDSVTVEGLALLPWNTTSQLTAFARDKFGAALFSGAGFTWVSSDPGLLSVDPNTGLVTANTLGTATITATLAGTILINREGTLDVTANSKIVFGSDRDGDDEIWVMNADGSGPMQLMTNTNYDNRSAFSPDGSKIVFESLRDGALPAIEIYIMNADGTGQTNLTMQNGDDRSPAFNHDGTKIAFHSFRTGDDEIFVMNADGTGQTNLTNNAATDSRPKFSPDGTMIAFMSDRDGNTEIYVMNSDGTGLVRLTINAAFDSAPAFSPDGLKIAFTSNRDGNNEIYVMNVDGSGVTRLTNDGAIDEDPAFSPDGSMIAFMSDRDGDNEIFIMNADGTGQTNLTNDPASDRHPAFPLN